MMNAAMMRLENYAGLSWKSTIRAAARNGSTAGSATLGKATAPRPSARSMREGRHHEHLLDRP